MQFDLAKCSKAGAKFDYVKAAWFNHEYILRKTDAELTPAFLDILRTNGIDTTEERARAVVGMMKSRVNFIKELWPLCKFFFVAPTEYDEKTVRKRWKEYSPQQMRELMEVLLGIGDFSVEGQETVVHAWIEDKDYKMGDIMNAWRLTLVGEGKGPGMFDISAFLGKEETLRRMEAALLKLKVKN